MAPRRKVPGTVVEGVKHDLAEIAKRDPRLSSSALALSALQLASQLDEPDNSATSKANCARVLLETLDRLRALAPAAREKDGIDELASKRAARRATA